MRTIREWLDDLKEVTGSDYMTAKRVGTSRQNISHYRSGRQLPSVKVCERMAEILDVSPLEIIASCEVQKDPNEAERWKKWVAAAAILSGVLFVDLFLESEAYAHSLNGHEYTLCAVTGDSRGWDQSSHGAIRLF